MRLLKVVADKRKEIFSPNKLTKKTMICKVHLNINQSRIINNINIVLLEMARKHLN